VRGLPVHTRWIETLAGGGEPSSIANLPERKTGIWVSLGVVFGAVIDGVGLGAVLPGVPPPGLTVPGFPPTGAVGFWANALEVRIRTGSKNRKACFIWHPLPLVLRLFPVCPRLCHNRFRTHPTRFRSRGKPSFAIILGEMSIAPLPTPLQHLGGRRFSFYPAIRNLEPNEWLYRRATWSECIVVNTSSGEEVWIPRVFLGEVSFIDEPVMIVRLNRELEWRSGAIMPRQRGVIELPVAVNDGRASPSRSGHLAPVVNIRLETKQETRAWKWAGVAVVLGAVAFTIVADIARQAQAHQRGDLFRSYRSYLQLNRDDDYASAIRKLGLPTASRSQAAGDRAFRFLNYAPRRYSVILMGSGTGIPRYIGTLDTRGRVLDAVRLPDGSTAEGLLNLSGAVNSSGLRSLPQF
jgi:hypothetical protein